MPKFHSQRDWQLAQVLMQPALIRVIDNIRKRLETSSWRGSYKTEQVWPTATTAAQKQQVETLQAQLPQAQTPTEIDEIEQQLSQLPAAIPLYELQLEKGDRQQTVDIWQLCYRVCFQNYDAEQEASPVDLDWQLIDQATGSVDWDQLDQKASQLVGDIFAQLWEEA